MKYKCTDCDFICQIPNIETKTRMKVYTLPAEAQAHLTFNEHHAFMPILVNEKK